MGLSRREALIDLLFTGLIGSSLGYGIKLGQDSYPLSSAHQVELTKRAQDLTQSIYQHKELPQVEINGRTVVPRINRGVVSEIVLSLAYMDGGEQTVRQVEEVIQKRKLIIGELEQDDRLVYGGFSYSGDPRYGLGLALTPQAKKEYPLNAAFYDTILFHELYHLIQYARNPELRMKLGAATVLCREQVGPILLSILAGKVVNDKILNKKENDHALIQIPSRRKFLAGAAGIVVGTAGYYSELSLLASRVIASTIEPYESQAYFQGGSVGINPLTGERPSLDGLLGAQIPNSLRGKLYQYS